MLLPMSLSLYNSLTKREEEFRPEHPPAVTMYTCGPTVYSRPHIGNYSAFLMADLLRRWLEAGHGYTVKHVKNITDVGHLLHDGDQGDDKVEREALKEQVHPLEIARRYADHYLADENALSLREPFARPRATEYVGQMREMVEDLLQKGIAYVTDDGVYFDVMQFPQYGALSGNTLEHLSAGARVEVNEAKRHPADFALWKFCVGPNAHHVLRWPSPTGPKGETFPEGFPGWHIECSAMSRALLGDTIDLHTGGEDNIFPHHECEIAQSESVTGKTPFVSLWLHKRRIDLGDQKMSKSLGNVLSLDDIVAQGFDLMDLRYYLLSVHYRTPLKFSWKGMQDARIARRRIMEWMGQCEEREEIKEREEGEWEKKFVEAMDSDLNTSAALAVIFDAMSWSRTHPDVSMQSFIASVRQTFGCFDRETTEALPEDVQTLVDERARARMEKDFASSDRLRDAIAAHGFTVRDTPDGQVVRRG